MDLPVALPATKLNLADWLVLATIKLDLGYKLAFKHLQLHVIAIIPQVSGTTASPTIINPAYGLAYVAIFKDFNVLTNPRSLVPVGSSLDVISASGVGVAGRDVSKDALQLTDIGDYSFVAINNTTDAHLRLAVAGAVRLTLA